MRGPGEGSVGNVESVGSEGARRGECGRAMERVIKS